MFCQKCGADVGESKFCPNCGNQIQQTIQQPAQQTPTIIINNTNTNVNDNTNINNFNGIGTISPKSKIAALILAIFLGYIGVHRFYVGKIGSGILYFFTGGLFIIGWIYDILKILSGTFTDGLGLPIRR